ncbi:spermidine synthase [Fictibacillus sp. NRS-1165]|uniref:spermine/spermidine synthase domain-containing protein n=1 Tax=Fictibacillus sp. NRS-1165 TaxID=3144463 RepID=UPI003D2417D1
MNGSKLWQSQHFINHQTSNDNKNQKLKQKSNPKDNKKHFRGDLWDRISLREMLAVKNKKLYQGQSKYQNIQVLEASDIRMYLDEQLQFSSLDERIYHEAFVHVPMALTKSHDNILILGGGDGLALREVLKYSDVKHVDLVDIDSEILKIASQVPEIVALNERSLFDKRVNVYAKDAREFLKKNKKTYDLMIIDFPDPADDFLASLYSLEMFQMVRNHLSKNGMIVCQSNSPFDTPVVYWSIGLTLEKTGFYTESYHTVIPSFGDWGFHLASNKPFPSKLKTVPVPCRTLPKNLASLFHFQSNTLSHQRSAIVNALDNLQLHEIYKKEIV